MRSTTFQWSCGALSDNMTTFVVVAEFFGTISSNMVELFAGETLDLSHVTTFAFTLSRIGDHNIRNIRHGALGK